MLYETHIDEFKRTFFFLVEWLILFGYYLFCALLGDRYKVNKQLICRWDI